MQKSIDAQDSNGILAKQVQAEQDPRSRKGQAAKTAGMGIAGHLGVRDART